MAIPPSGTFDYVVTVPDDLRTNLGSARLREPIERTGNRLWDARLVGHAPKIMITDAGPTPNPGYTRGVWRPLVQRSQISLSASKKKDASVGSASFYVAKGLVAALRPRDIIYMVRTPCGRLGVSVIRDDLLVAGMGAITEVPLGRDVKASGVADLAKEAADIFKRRDPDFDWFHFPETPVELEIGTHRYIRYKGRFEVEGYEVMVMHGFYPGIPGRDECVAIARLNACNPIAVIDSAFLIDIDGLEMGKK